MLELRRKWPSDTACLNVLMTNQELRSDMREECDQDRVWKIEESVNRP